MGVRLVGIRYELQPESGRECRCSPMFRNRPAAYDYFVANGKWLDKTMFVLEVFGSTSRARSTSMAANQTEFSGWTWK